MELSRNRGKPLSKVTKKMKSLLCTLLIPVLLVPLWGSCGKDPLTPNDTAKSDSVIESETQLPFDTEEWVDTEEEEKMDDGTKAELEQKKEPQEYNISLNPELFKVQGRSSNVEYAVTTDWSASGIEFQATYIGTIRIEGKGTSNGIHFRTYVNGRETGTVSFGEQYQSKLIPGTDCTKEQTAHIRLVRIEYVKDGLASLKTVLLNGTVDPWTENDKSFIEFVGDSITCGYGSVSKDSSKDGSRTFAYLTACELDVDYSMVSISGIGVSASTPQHNGSVMGDFYRYSCRYRNDKALYTPPRKADLVVVNLNTNDNNRGATEESYKAKAKELIADIRAIHGENVSIIWIFGQMTAVNTPVNGWLRTVFAELGGEAAGLYIMETTQDNSGGDRHPNYANHEVTSEKLIAFINSKTLLK
ncbi:MAG: hypothetical protein E7668_00130 [Ruminococcaceae bacterium]|nr:hypothetical protein [Oscillospiraceae bacterium]